MTFKKCLRTKKSRRGQAALEYFIVFAILALITILSLSSFHGRMLSSTRGFFQAVVVGTHGLNVENN